MVEVRITKPEALAEAEGGGGNCPSVLFCDWPGQVWFGMTEVYLG